MSITLESLASPQQLLSAAVRALGASAGGASATKLLGLLYDPDVDIDRIQQCLRSEPVLAARVLKVANAPYYGRSGQVGSVERAMQLLGLQAIRGIAAAGALDRITPARAGQVFDPVRFRRHSAAVAGAAQGLSRKAGCGVDSEAFISGLMHDIGLLLLVKADPAAMASFEPPSADSQSAATDAERTHFGVDHEAAGALLVESWGLPPWLKTAVAAHHGADTTTAVRGMEVLPRLLNLGDRMASSAGFGLWPRCESPLTDADFAGLGLGPEDVQSLMETLPEVVDALTTG